MEIVIEKFKDVGNGWLRIAELPKDVSFEDLKLKLQHACNSGAMVKFKYLPNTEIVYHKIIGPITAEVIDNYDKRSSFIIDVKVS